MYLSSRFFFLVAAVAVGAGEAAGRALHNLRLDAQIFPHPQDCGVVRFLELGTSARPVAQLSSSTTHWPKWSLSSAT